MVNRLVASEDAAVYSDVASVPSVVAPLDASSASEVNSELGCVLSSWDFLVNRLVASEDASLYSEVALVPSVEAVLVASTTSDDASELGWVLSS